MEAEICEEVRPITELCHFDLLRVKRYATELDALLRCAICFEYMNTTMLAQGCSHNYCSLCIRRYICYKQQCPTCLEPVVDSDLKNNRIVDQVIEIFRKCISNRTSTVSSAMSVSSSSYSTSSRVLTTTSSSCTTLKTSCSSSYSLFNRAKESSKILKNKPIETHVDLSDDDSDETVDGSPRSLAARSVGNDSLCNPQNNIACEEKNSDEDFDDSKLDTKSSKSLLLSPPPISRSTVLSPASSSTNSPASASCNKLLSPSVSVARTQSYSTSNQLMSLGSRSIQTQSNGDTVPCPVCSVEVPARNINLHLDRCLSSDKKDTDCIEVPSRTIRRKPLPKLVYNLLSDKELRKKNAEVGLPVLGDRKLMIQRHREYTLVYNSECDSLNPKSGPEIVREILRSEGTKMLASASAPPPPTMSRVEKGASGELVEIARKSYVKEHKSQFAELIAAARLSRQAAKSAKLMSTAPTTDVAQSINSDIEESDKPDYSFFSDESCKATDKQALNTLASDSENESSNQVESGRLNKSVPSNVHLVEESSSELASSTSLPPSQVLKCSIGENDDEIQQSPDLFIGAGVLSMSPPALFNRTENETKSTAEAVKQKTKVGKGRKKHSRASHDCNDSDDSWEPEVLVNNNRKRKLNAASSLSQLDSEDDDLLFKIDTAAACSSGRRKLRSKPNRSRDDVDIEDAVTCVDDGVSAVVEDATVDSNNLSTNRRQSTRARKVNKKH